MIGDKIRDLRESKRWTMRELAAKAEITHVMVSRYENAQANPTKRILKRLSIAFEIPLTELTSELPSPGSIRNISDQTLNLAKVIGELSAEDIDKVLFYVGCLKAKRTLDEWSTKKVGDLFDSKI